MGLSVSKWGYRDPPGAVKSQLRASQKSRPGKMKKINSVNFEDALTDATVTATKVLTWQRTARARASSVEIYSETSAGSGPPPPGKLSTLTQIGPFVLRKKLGEGSFAHVREGVHQPTGAKVAIKLFNKDADFSEYEKRHFDREATLQVLSGKHVYALVFELIHSTVLEKIDHSGVYTESQARSLIRQVMAGVEALHDQGIVHRDLKPENIGLDHSGNVKLLDFGLCGDLQKTEFLETQCGTMLYSAPELLGESPYGKEVDVWSIGVVLYAVLVGKLPYSQTDSRGNLKQLSLTHLHALMLDHQYEMPSHLSEPVVDLLRQLFEVKPRKRITLKAMWQHAWIAGDPAEPPISQADVSTRLTTDTVDVSVASEVASYYNSESTESVALHVLSNRPTVQSAHYYLSAMVRSNPAIYKADTPQQIQSNIGKTSHTRRISLKKRRKRSSRNSVAPDQPVTGSVERVSRGRTSIRGRLSLKKRKGLRPKASRTSDGSLKEEWSFLQDGS